MKNSTITNQSNRRPIQKSKLNYLLAILLCLALLAACGQGSSEEPEPTAAPEIVAEVEEATEAEEAEEAEEETAEEVEPTAEPEEEAEAPAEEAEEVPAAVTFKMPTNNAIVPTTFSVVMDAVGVSVDPAGDILENSGHMHILVDRDFIPAGEVIPSDDQHLHYGDGSLMTELELAPGSHTLRLQLANGAHMALEGDEYRDEIVVTVKEDAPEQSVRFSSPLDGAVVPPTLDISMAAAGLFVDPAGDILENSGHMHILVDTDFVPAGEVIINDEQHLHFGAAQLEATLELTPGEHTLRLQMANGAHIALDGDQYRDEITVTVEEGAASQAVRFVQPADGETVGTTVDVQMSAVGLFVEGSGAVLREEGGHMHILIDTDFIEAGNVVPADDQHIHFGGGQTTAQLSLEPGEHTLRLQMANGAHIALDGSQYQAEITITVSDESADAGNDSSADASADSANEDSDATNESAVASAASAADRNPAELWSSMTCSACHNLDEMQSSDNIGQPGPHMGNLFQVADTRVDGQEALAYVIASIVEPNAYVNEGYVASVMPQNFAEKMSETEISNLAAWILDADRVN